MAGKYSASAKPAAKAKGKKGELTVDGSMADFKLCYKAKHKLIERELEDHRFALGEQWSAEDREKLRSAGMVPFTDNRIQPNLFLLTGLERQNRTDFKAFPQGEEDSIKAEIASALFKDAITKSGFAYKSSEQFKDGITCGESHLELYLDNTDSLINGKPCWKKIDGNMLFPHWASREYDFSDAPFVYKLTLAIAREDLINLYPDKKKKIEAADGGKLELSAMLDSEAVHTQKRDYGKVKNNETDDDDSAETFDLLERFYKKWTEKIFVGDRKTGEINQAENAEKAQAMVDGYKAGIQNDQKAFDTAVQQALSSAGADPEFAALPIEEQAAALHEAGAIPPEPPEQDPERYIVFKRMVPEIWCFAHVSGLDEPLCDEPAWSYPKWKGYPFIPYFARFSTAPLQGDDRHLLVQGLVHQAKGAQERHNKAEMLMQRHLNSSANSGWLAEEGAWLDESKVQKFGTQPGVNLYYKKDKPKPTRIEPGQLSPGHAEISASSAEAIKAQLGINADLLATQQGGTDSGRAIALRQRQGLLMVQELFDNLTRTRKLAGSMLLAHLGDVYDTETAMKILGEAWLQKNFPPIMLPNPEDPEAEPQAIADEHGEPMKYDKDLAELAISEVLLGNLGEYDVAVGEAVSSETQRMANSAELMELSGKMPIPPDILVRHSQLPETTKSEILKSFQAQATAAVTPPGAPPTADAAA